jgi:hypothetical protein
VKVQPLAQPTHVQSTDISYLLAEDAARNASPTYFDADRFYGGETKECKRYWVHNWRNADDRFEWSVDVHSSGEYEVSLLIEGAARVNVEIACGSDRLLATLARDGWDKVTVPQTLFLPTGHNTITVRSPNPAGGQNGMALKSVELVPAVIRDTIDQRVKAFRSDTTWLGRAHYGLMCQCGEWSYPLHGDKKLWPRQIDDFDVDAFADMAQSVGAGYAIWSATWTTYFFPAPIQAIDAILPGRTSERDLIGDLADTLAKRGIKLIVYYHTGHDLHLERGLQGWWANNWVSHHDKTRFFDNWCAIITQVGERYGSRLAGWWFDDGVVYYPAPFERLGQAAKAGNPARVIAYNPWISARVTDFQDYQAGEGWTGDASMPVGGTGIYTDGPHCGLHAHGCFELDGPGWGIHTRDTPLSPPQFTAEQGVKIASLAAERNQALSWNVMMYEDGFVSLQSLETLRAVRQAIRA